jgi:asparagine synthase (glutamine-hydrolysing)
LVRALAHRGPNGEGTVWTEGAGLGHTRLAIIDPSHASDQPMVDPPTGCVLVFNGEIYNYHELRSELEAAGHLFSSAGDTEVLLRSYLQWGEGCLDRLNGMFAFAIWDSAAGNVFLARDRLGEKPLHLCQLDGSLWFASEIKALVEAGAARPDPDHGYLLGFLALGDLGDATATPFASVRQLPAGHCLRAWPDGRQVLRQYWSVPAPTDDSSAAGSFAELFRDSIRLRLRSDVPLGTSLSGGLDSSLVLATVRSHRPDGDLHTFTASFPGSPADELSNAKTVANKFAATVHPVPLGATDLAEGLDDMIIANEGPVESPSTFAQFRVMQSARAEGVTVLLDGQGSDETWGGYEKYSGDALFDDALRFHFLRALVRAREWQRVRGAFPRPSIGVMAGLLAGPAARQFGRLRTSSRWLAADYCAAHGPAGITEDLIRACRPGQLASEHMRLDLQRVTLPRLLRYADRNSMAWSREVRLPFLDHRLVELAARTPFNQKVVDGWSKEPVRRLLEDLGLPEVARRRDKKAYMPPTADWLAERAIRERVTEACLSLHGAGILASARPPTGTLAQWRILSVSAWADGFRVHL